MSPRKKLVNTLCAAQIVAAILVVVVPWAVFPVCEPPMHCHFSYMAEVGMAAVVLCAALMSTMSKGMEASRMLCVVTAVAGAFVILYPSAIIGVCASPKMACRYGALPVWNLLGGTLVITSIVVFFASGEDPV